MTPASRRARLLGLIAGNTLAWLALAAVALTLLAFTPARAADIPRFEVDAAWPKPLPNNWILGQVGGITVDAQGHIWVIHRPRSLTEDENGAGLTPPRSKCCVAAPPVLEFDSDGNLLRSWAAPVKATPGSAASTASRSMTKVSSGSAAISTTTMRS